ncbi:unnamed protein product [Aspergillus oryzae]|uniref:Unnamed protein product n=2 Tax=Aspergillus oryzae TaxID=5062 RepID=A0AAN4YHD9_ASPOZ|nr:unnamed protein product [Aspergillus oryzae]GMF84592.1 unnamed protein product [Aspergillus oryzae]GMG12940.1 unnamed protein product [Aspergillus oryzae]GMG26762.1 unnamed protein product [Aspergillus oryzae]GMG47372.1 unnamed protein product [Aspergillus oryzae var. brunneus]
MCELWSCSIVEPIPDVNGLAVSCRNQGQSNTTILRFVCRPWEEDSDLKTPKINHPLLKIMSTETRTEE